MQKEGNPSKKLRYRTGNSPQPACTMEKKRHWEDQGEDLQDFEGKGLKKSKVEETPKMEVEELVMEEENSESEDETQKQVKEAITDEQLKPFNDFNYWRIPLPPLELETEESMEVQKLPANNLDDNVRKRKRSEGNGL